jgi:hypothetical protein
MKNSSKPICGAKNRAGNPCEKPPLRGKTRCKLHGGASLSGRNVGSTNKNHRHGLYAKWLNAEEAEAWQVLPTGDLDDEIRMVRIWLARAMAHEAASSQPMDRDGTELAEIRRSTMSEDGSRTDIITRKPDIAGRIDRLLGRLAQLERTQSELKVAAQTAGEGVGDRARQIRATLMAMIDVETKPPADEDDGDGDVQDEP